MSGGEILFLAHRVPYPPNRGDKIRSWNVLKALSKIAPVHVAALCDDPADLAYAETIEAVAASVFLQRHQTNKLASSLKALLTGGSASVQACWSGALNAHVQKVLQDRPISAVYAFSGQMAQYVPANAPRFVMDFVDMDSAKFATWAAEKSGFAAMANGFEARRLFAHEARVAARADTSLFVSEDEAGLFRSRTGQGERIAVLENGVDTDHFDPTRNFGVVDAPKGALIVFTGQMNYQPNVDAVKAFASHVLPRIQAVTPDACFAIVGRAPTAEVQKLAALPGIIVTGEVADTRDWLAAADVAVSPLMLARGIQNKVLEAMAMARPVVATHAAAQGIDAEEGRDFVKADSAEAQAHACIEILTNAEKARDLGNAARARMIARYGWDAQMQPLPAYLGMAA
jgi:polysaccharide biosynthesis protein PslH